MGIFRCNIGLNRNMDRRILKTNNMKTLLLILLSATAYGQSVHYDTVAARAYVNIAPVAVPAYMRTVSTITRLYVTLDNDNLFSSGVFRYELRGTSDGNYTVVTSGTYSISGSDYTNWNANDNMAAFQYVAGKAELNLTIIE